MKLRNKKTGEIMHLSVKCRNGGELRTFDLNTNTDKPITLAELNAEWEDYEEPKDYWFINDLDGKPMKCELRYCRVREFTEWSEKRKQIGNYFETKEEAEQAVEKLKAWKRLKDKGFRFSHIRSIDGVSIKYKDLDQYTIIAYADEDGCDQECLNLLFGGEE